MLDDNLISRQIEVFEYRKSQVGTTYSAAENAIAETANTIGHCSFIIADVCRHVRSTSEQL